MSGGAEGRGRGRARALWIAATLLALVWAAASAAAMWWTTDDAFISFRYAENLVRGNGLVFNAGERVEGFTNLLWTLWIAAGLAVGVAAETWANASGLACYVLAVLLLAWNRHALGGVSGVGPWLPPVAALLAAAHRDWAVFSVSGLETGAFTLLILAGFLLAAWSPDSPARVAAAGAVFALASLTRPDGLLLAVVAGAFVLSGRRRPGSAAAYAMAFALIWVPATVWRVGYYGEFLPNTFYAKSAGMAWWSQGWSYLLLYFEKYWALLAGPVLLAGAWLVRGARRSVPSELDAVLRRQAVLASALALAYTLYVVRVGGDFMFARFLVPVTPFLLVLAEAGWIVALRRRPVVAWIAASVAALALVLTPSPVTGTDWRHGIADERAYYSEERVAELDRWAEVLARHFEGLPARVAFYGDEARIVYRARFPVAVEGHTGLTDRYVARLPLARRGRPGHEKLAPAGYLIDERRLHFTFSNVPQRALGLGEWIPEVIVRFDGDVYGQALHWDPALMEELRRRGARVPDFPALLDRYIRELPRLPDERVARDWPRFRRFYFDHVADPAREEPFRRRLEGR